MAADPSSSPVPAAPQPTLAAGVARVVITPPVGIHLTGYAGRPPSIGIHDDLTATALVLAERGADGQDPPAAGRVALLALDVLYLPPGQLRKIKQRIAEASGIPAERILINCSHTHFGPVIGEDPDDASGGDGRERQDRREEGLREGGQELVAVAYREALAHHLAGLVGLANERVRPVALSAGRGSVKVGINRREWKDGRVILGQNPEGVLDSEVIVWRFDAADGPPVDPGAPPGWVHRAPEPVAVVVNYACHGTSLASRMRLISADFPGVMREVVERLVGGTALFLQGAAGNINPALVNRPADDVPGWDPWESPLRSGRALGAEAVRVALQATPIAALPLRVARETLDLPGMLPVSVEAGRARIAQLEAAAERLAQQPESPSTAGQRQWNVRTLRRARRALEALEGGEPLPPITGDVAALRIGDAALATNPSELFCEIGMAIKQASPFPYTAVAAYTDGAVGYIPTRAAYPEGGYEVDRACRVNPEAGDMVHDTSLSLLRSLR